MEEDRITSSSFTGERGGMWVDFFLSPTIFRTILFGVFSKRTRGTGPKEKTRPLKRGLKSRKWEE